MHLTSFPYRLRVRLDDAVHRVRHWFERRPLALAVFGGALVGFGTIIVLARIVEIVT